MTYSETAKKYCRDVVSGKINACSLVQLACQRHLDDLGKQKDKDYPFRFEEERANKRCGFSEKFRHVKGRWAGKLFVLEDRKSTRLNSSH